MDVGANIMTKGRPDLKQIICFLIYQVFLAFMFMVSYIPIIGMLIAKIGTAVVALIPIFGNTNFTIADVWRLNPRKSNYPYFKLWFGSFPPAVLDQNNPKSRFSLVGYRPSSPVTFFFGKDKPF